MQLIPALDLMSGRAVCLDEGRRTSAVVFHERPQELIPYLTYGSDRLHVVDHDGAGGEARQLDLLTRIVRDSPIPVQIAGGVRDATAIDQLLRLGAASVVLDSALAKTPVILEQLVRTYSSRVLVGIEARNGVVIVGGWAVSSGTSAIELGQFTDNLGCGGLVYTDVTRAGANSSPNVTAAAALVQSVKCQVIVSGAIGTLDDIARVRDAKVHGCVVGRALYEQRFSVLDAVRAAHG